MASADTPNGTQVRTFFSRAQNVQSAPEVDSDSVVYVTQNLGTLHAFNPNGSQRWAYTSSTNFNYLNLNPQNSLLLAGGRLCNKGGEGEAVSISPLCLHGCGWRILCMQPSSQLCHQVPYVYGYQTLPCIPSARTKWPHANS